MNKRLIITALVAVTLVGLTVMKLLSNKSAVEKKIYIHDVEAAILVKDISPSIHTFESAFTFLGIFEPFRQNTIGSDAQGKLIRLNVEEGDKVSQGQVIAKALLSSVSTFIRRTNSVPVVIFPHWSLPPICNKQLCVLCK